MKRIALLFFAMLLFASAATASEYPAFTKDMVKPYDFYKKTLSLTNKKEDADKAKVAIASFIEAWSLFASKYAVDVPKPFAGMRDFSVKIKRPIEVGKLSLEQMKAGEIEKAHYTLEEVRYLMWDMRVKSNIVSLSDKANDFHEAMEIVLDHAAAAKDPDSARKVHGRYGGWFLIKWEDMANAADAASVQKDFDHAFNDGRKAVAAYLEALKQGDLALAKKLSGEVKGAYKKIWMLNYH